jgi:hypothetical protein
MVDVGDGDSTSFWHDHWVGDAPLAATFPALFSHFAGRKETVREVMTTGLQRLLQPRLTARATEELQEITCILQSVNLGDSPDLRLCGMENNDHKLATGLIYKASVRGDQKAPFFAFVWNNFAPPRVKFFAWLLVQNRIQCKTNLRKKNILDDDTCELCNNGSDWVPLCPKLLGENWVGV